MPKLKVKPTPVQARILKAFIAHPKTGLYYCNGRCSWTGHNSWLANKISGKPRASTVRKMISEGWLQPICYKENIPSMSYELSESGHTVFDGLEDDDFVSRSKWGWNEAEVLNATKKRFGPPDWLFIEQYVMPTPDRWNYRIADAFALRLSAGDGRSKYLDRWCFEVKVDRADWKKELDDPTKRVPAMDFAHYFTFVAPLGLIDPKEVPDQCGLYEIGKTGKLRVKVRPMKLESPVKIDWYEVAKLVRAAMKG